MDISMPTCSEKRNGAGDRGKGEMEPRVKTEVLSRVKAVEEIDATWVEQ